MTTPAIRTVMGPAEWSLLILLGVIWGSGFFFAHIAVIEIPPLTLVLLRVGIAALALHVYLLATGVSFVPALQRWPLFVALSLANNVIPFSLIFLGQTVLGAGVASVLNATTPFWTIIIANATTRDEKASWNKVAGVLFGIAGTALMIGPGLIAGLGGPVWAKLALIGAAVCYAIALIIARRFRGMAPTLVATGQVSASTLIMIPIVLLTNGTAGMFGLSALAWFSVLALALLSTSLGYLLYFSLIARAGATNASLVTLIVPVSAILLGAIFLGERLELFEVGGMVLIAIGLITIDGRLLPGGRLSANRPIRS
jgi:drug/metabolite transporter (DMT)-like permease